jgi:hypothetical protein
LLNLLDINRGALAGQILQLIPQLLNVGSPAPNDNARLGRPQSYRNLVGETLNLDPGHSRPPRGAILDVIAHLQILKQKVGVFITLCIPA